MFRTLDIDIKAAKKIRLPWWGVLCGIIGSTLGAWLFDHLGRLDLAIPVLLSIAVLAFSIAVKWQLRQRVWFWITMTVIATLHVLLILSVSWPTEWVPALVITPIITVDFYAILWILSVVGKHMEREVG